jgi:hypothetical protein
LPTITPTRALVSGAEDRDVWSKIVTPIRHVPSTADFLFATRNDAFQESKLLDDAALYPLGRSKRKLLLVRSPYRFDGDCFVS